MASAQSDDVSIPTKALSLHRSCSQQIVQPHSPGSITTLFRSCAPAALEHWPCESGRPASSKQYLQKQWQCWPGSCTSLTMLVSSGVILFVSYTALSLLQIALCLLYMFSQSLSASLLCQGILLPTSVSNESGCKSCACHSTCTSVSGHVLSCKHKAAVIQCFLDSGMQSAP